MIDWLAREGWILVNYWLLSSAAALAVIPMLFRLLPAMPDRGVTLARTAGTMLVPLLYWFIAVLGLMPNTAGSMVLAWIIVLGLSVVVVLQVRRDNQVVLRDWWRANGRIVLAAELLFLVMLVAFALFRAHQNTLTTTEKPMDLAFMSAIQQSESFPPDDPWFSGYAISYYYFGYAVSAMNATLAGVPSTTGYNMHLALIFALAAQAAFGVVANLARIGQREEDTPAQRAPGSGRAILAGTLGAVILLMMGNFHFPLVEVPFRNAWFDDSYYSFWDAKDRDYQPMFGRDLLDPADRGENHFWYFGNARVITERLPTRDIDAGEYYNGIIQQTPQRVGGELVNEVIDETPAFSFVLGDSHPHVMTLPFVLLALGLALNIAAGKAPPGIAQTLLYGVVIGGLIFANTWDAPIYIIVMVGAELIRRVRRMSSYGRGITAYDWGMLLTFGVALLLIGVLSVLPFLIGFRSQLAGVLPNVLFPTRPQQLFLVFGPFLLLLGGYLTTVFWGAGRQGRMSWAAGWSITSIVLLGLILLAALLVNNGAISPSYQLTIARHIPPPTPELASGRDDAWAWLNSTILTRRLDTLLTHILLLTVIALSVARLLPGMSRRGGTEASHQPMRSVAAYTTSQGFVVLIVGAGAGLVLIPEFIYLRDNFGWRMNTVFKLYYQAWVLFSIASAYAVYRLVLLPPGGERGAVMLRWISTAVAIVVVGGGTTYFAIGTYWRAVIEPGRLAVVQEREIDDSGESQLVSRIVWRDVPLTLDGGGSFTAPVDYAAIRCLEEQIGREAAVVAEANPKRAIELEPPGMVNYNPNHARTGSLTGIPVVLGWPGHQEQWRGVTYAPMIDARSEALDLLFEASALNQVEDVIAQYGITHVLYGTIERSYYGISGEQKFVDNYELICEVIDESAMVPQIARVYRVTPLQDVLPSEDAVE